MSLLRNTLTIIMLLTIAWIGFIIVTYILAHTLFPAIEYADGTLLIGLLRVIVGVAIIALWIYGWYTLTKIMLRKMLS
ncbi:MAG: hypothetical protein QXF28_01745 [Nitrososphaerota archaeon]